MWQYQIFDFADLTSLSFLLLFSVPPSKLELVHSEASISLNAGAERQLSCRARDARPQAKIVWYQGDHKIVDQGIFESIDITPNFVNLKLGMLSKGKLEN